MTYFKRVGHFLQLRFALAIWLSKRSVMSDERLLFASLLMACIHYLEYEELHSSICLEMFRKKGVLKKLIKFFGKNPLLGSFL